MQVFNQELYKDYSREELIQLVCTVFFDLKISKHILKSVGYDMKQPLDYSYYKSVLDPKNELKGII